MNAPEPEATPLSADEDSRVLAALKEYQEALDAGQRPDRAALLARHADVADVLREYLDALEVVRAAAPRLHLPARAELLPGTLLGSYRIVREVGRGGMGVVYEAVQETLGRRVALKVLPPAAVHAPALRARFRREAQAAARLHHTNIVPVFGVGDHDGVLFYAMPLIPGRGLDAILRDLRAARGSPAPAAATPGPVGPGSTEVPVAAVPGEPTLPADGPPGRYFRRVAEVGVQAADALDYAHRQGVLHRDVKPSNLLLDEDGTAWVVDFGLARLEGAEDLTDPGELVGTLRYLAPERLAGHCDARSDVYSLGATLYELATLRPPHEDTDRLRLLDRIRHEAPVRPRSLAPDLPADLETIVLKALDREPARRYASAGELADDLRRFLADLPIQARPLRPHQRLARWCRRNPALAALAGVVVLATAVTVVSLSAAVVLVGGALEEAKEARGLAEREGNTARERAAESARLADSERQLRTRMQRDTARLLLEKACEQCQQEDGGVGVLWLTRALVAATQAGEPALEEAARLHLAVWGRTLHRLVAVRPLEGRVYLGPAGPGRVLLSDPAGTEVRAWDLRSGAPVGPILRHPARVGAADLDASGTHAVTGCADGMARVWDLTRGSAEGPPLSHPRPVVAVAFGLDGRLVLTADDAHVVRCWRRGTGEPVGKPLPCSFPVRTLAGYPDGRRLLAGDNYGQIQGWDLEKGKLLDLWPGRPAHFTRPAVSPTGKRLLLANLSGEVMVRDVQTRKPVGFLFPHGGPVVATAFSPDGQLALVACQDRGAQLWDVASREPVGPPMRHPRIADAAFGPDGRTVLTFGWDRCVRLWEVQPAPRPLWSLTHAQGVQAVAYHPDGQSVLTACRDGTARRWETCTGRALLPPLRHPAAVLAAAFSPDGTLILTGCADHGARLWEGRTGKPVGIPLAHPGPITAVGFAPDGKFLLTETSGRGVRRWDGTTRRLVPPFRAFSCMAPLSWSPDGQALLMAASNSALILDMKAFVGRSPVLPQWSQVTALAWGPDDRLLLTAGKDGMVWAWERASGRPLWRRKHQAGPIHALAFRRDSRICLSAGGPGTLRLAETATGRLLGPPLRSATGIWCAAFAPDGRTILTGGHDALAHLWEVPGPWVGKPEQLARWAEEVTGLELDEHDVPRSLDAAAWRRRR